MFNDWLLVSSLIFGGCCSNVFSLETLINARPLSGHLITFSQFLFVSSIGIYHQLDFTHRWPRLRQTVIPIQYWFVMVLLFWSVSVLNNYALSFRIPMPLHIIFRSGSLIVAMLVSLLFFNQRYALITHSDLLPLK